MGELIVMSFNIGHGKTREGTVSLERAARVVEESGAGLVGLQDVDRYCPRSYFDDQARVLAKWLSMYYAFVPAGRLPGRLGSGLALLSRYPVIHHTSHRLNFKTDLALQRAAIDFDGIRVTCLNASLRATESASSEACRGILAICRSLRTPAVLTIDAGLEGSGPTGAFWQDAGSRCEDVMKSPLRHSRPRGGIFVSPHWELNGSRVYRTAWSANWPLIAVASLPPQQDRQDPAAGDEKAP
ncbi:MAG TPA: endonuclease/exonuclease/phosphatase family protein [Spirochaetia bacterium]|nr:endonuclease/exonuclease/phosphatase family protein [Spirochaetia bacterium]